ncbi:S53 family peptidase [Nannocystis pusilla]|uniref:S53 family serine peptidase n=1 Tax=Nannocystis pusilla TaxID=889268 RepID=A0ABS7TVF9_9BACT|nr:S53 family serine peptidase [Nannocystis pusilla]
MEGTVAYTRRIASWAALLTCVGACPSEDIGVSSATEGGSGTTDSALPGTGASEGVPTTTNSGVSGSGGDNLTGWETTGADDPVGPCATDPLCDIPPEEHEPTNKPDGLPSPLPGVYDDLGPAPLDNGFRSLMGFPNRQRELLEERVAAMYDPDSPSFRDYLTVDEWMADHAPRTKDVDIVKAWLKSRGFTINYEAKNRLLVHFSGSVKDFNETFDTELHICMRKNPLHSGDPFPVYCTLESFTLPIFVAERTHGLATADLPAETGTLTKEVGDVVEDYPGDDAHGPPAFYGAYNMNKLFADGYDGTGSAIGVVGAGTYHTIDLQIFWKSFGIERELPTRVALMEPVFERITETSLDTQWSSSLGPGADVFVYEGPDARNTALLFAWNEAIGDNKADVVTTSFAHREDAEAKTLRHQYDESALMGAAIGMTLLSASGDSANPDTPCSSPYVTCVGGTNLVATPTGVISSERAWSMSGSGNSKSFAPPYWQEADVDSETRAMCDLALSSSPENPMWMRRWKKWEAYGGTSFASPAFAGMVAVVNSYRKAHGKPRVGYLNPVIYLHGPTRATFRDITKGATPYHSAGVGWDYPTGLGAPDIAALAATIP